MVGLYKQKILPSKHLGEITRFQAPAQVPKFKVG